MPVWNRHAHVLARSRHRSILAHARRAIRCRLRLGHTGDRRQSLHRRIRPPGYLRAAPQFFPGIQSTRHHHRRPDRYLFYLFRSRALRSKGCVDEEPGNLCRLPSSRDHACRSYLCVPRLRRFSARLNHWIHTIPRSASGATHKARSLPPASDHRAAARAATPRLDHRARLLLRRPGQHLVCVHTVCQAIHSLQRTNRGSAPDRQSHRSGHRAPDLYRTHALDQSSPHDGCLCLHQYSAAHRRHLSSRKPWHGSHLAHKLLHVHHVPNHICHGHQGPWPRQQAGRFPDRDVGRRRRNHPTDPRVWSPSTLEVMRQATR